MKVVSCQGATAPARTAEPRSRASRPTLSVVSGAFRCGRAGGLMTPLPRPLTAVLALLALAIASAAVVAAPTLPQNAQPAPAPLAPFTPTPQEVVDRMLQMAEVTKADVVYDLGSGDGRLVITAAKRYGARGVGVDID